MKRQRIVITGLGGLCCLGTNATDIWSAMKSGTCGLGPIVNEPLHEVKVAVGGEIGLLPEHDLDRRALMTMARFSLLAVLAAKEAFAQAGLAPGSFDAERAGACIGVGVYGTDAVETNYRDILVEGKKRANVFTVPKAMPSAPAGQVSMACGLTGPVFGVTSACSSSNHAVASACDQLRAGRADIMLAGGTDTPISYGILKAWEALRVLARENCRPFSADRDGLVLSDGAGIAVLETLEHAQARGATILAEVAGSGLSADASDITSPTVEGPAAAMQRCLADAGLNAGDVDYINAHGTATQYNDRIETQAIRRVFGSDADALSVSSTKSMHGHCLGASGAVEMIACVNAINENIVPPTAGYNEPDPDCDLDVTPNTARERTVDVALSNAFAFGGTNAVLAFKRFVA